MGKIEIICICKPIFHLNWCSIGIFAHSAYFSRGKNVAVVSFNVPPLGDSVDTTALITGCIRDKFSSLSLGIEKSMRAV